MRHEFHLQAYGSNDSGTLTWDSESGTVTGHLATLVDAALTDAEGSGSVTTHPYPTTYLVKDPRHDPAEFGLVISTLFPLPKVLATAVRGRYPAEPEDHQEHPGLVY